jgi:hypothetical protein
LSLYKTTSSAFVLLLASGAEAQTVDLIQQELTGIRTGIWRLGAFYVTPSLQFSGGYDSNALSTPVPENDIRAMVGPGVRLAVPLGETAYFDVYEEVDYVWYQEQVELRRFFDVTSVGAGIGGRRWLLDVNDHFRDETARPTSEFDFPVVQRSNELEGDLSFALGWRHLLKVGYGQSSYDIRETLEDDEVVKSRLNRTLDRGILEFRRRLTAKTNAVVEANFERFRFDDSTRDGDSWVARFGFEFTPEGTDPMSVPALTGSFVNGRFLLGYRTVSPLDVVRVDYAGLVGSVDVTFGFGEGHRLQATYSRDIVPSIFDENWFFVENRWGASFHFQLTERFSLTPAVLIGQNSYPLPQETLEGTEEEIYDDHTTFRLAFDTRLTDNWTVGIVADYLKRDSNVFAFAKDRLQVGFTMGFRP